ncbi:chromatin target of PRMT1 protein-like isoform X2 [Ornithodoros turicata]
MSTQAKIVMKNTTKISLNERFTAYRQQAESSLSLVQAKVQQQRQQASLRNLRLAQQMANRPSVIAALKLKKRSLKQRLGPTNGAVTPMGVKSRLGIGGVPLHNRLGPRGGVSSYAARNTAGTSPMLRSRLGYRNGPPPSGARSYGGGQVRRGRGFNRNLYRTPRNGNTLGGQMRRNPENSRRMGRGGGRRGARTGRGGARGRLPSRDELDSQLDAYMAKTRNHLDAELEAYMAQSDM